MPFDRLLTTCSKPRDLHSFITKDSLTAQEYGLLVQEDAEFIKQFGFSMLRMRMITECSADRTQNQYVAKVASGVDPFYGRVTNVDAALLARAKKQHLLAIMVKTIIWE